VQVIATFSLSVASRSISDAPMCQQAPSALTRNQELGKVSTEIF